MAHHLLEIHAVRRREVERLIVEEYNRTRQLPEFARARILIGNVLRRWYDGKAGRLRSNGPRMANVS